MDHDTNTCTLRQWPASAREVIQVRPGTISDGGGGRGGGGGCCPLQTQYEKWGPFNWPALFKYVITGYNLWPRRVSTRSHPLWDTLASATWGSARENWAYVIFNISSIHFAVSLRPLKLCPSNLLHILPDHFTTAFCCRMFFIYSLGGST